jgi:hypothetical protein
LICSDLLVKFDQEGADRGNIGGRFQHLHGWSLFLKMPKMKQKICEENKLTVDGEFYFNISKPILQRKKKHIVNKPTTFNQHKTDDE